VSSPSCFADNKSKKPRESRGGATGPDSTATRFNYARPKNDPLFRHSFREAAALEPIIIIAIRRYSKYLHTRAAEICMPVQL